MIKSLPQLENLDNQEVSSEERRKLEAYSLEDLLGAGSSELILAGAGGDSPTKRKSPIT